MQLKDQIANIPMYKIGKNEKDALREVTQNRDFIQAVIHQVGTNQIYEGARKQPQNNSLPFTRRTAVGTTLALAPKNYPLNEAYAAKMPALLVENIVKIPAVGGLVHLKAFQALAETLRPGTINLVAGWGGFHHGIGKD